MSPMQRPVPPGLAPYENETVVEFAELPTNVFSWEDRERHYVYSLLLFGIIYGQWNGNKFGETGDYGIWRPDQQTGKTTDDLNVYGGGTYLGHNIAALAVDADGRIIDYDFNHNQIFDSTVEHAESRLVRRVFALNQTYDSWFALNQEGALEAAASDPRGRIFATATSDRAAPPRSGLDVGLGAEPASPTPYSTLLKDVTIYTSLESCAQCSGIMCLGSVKDIVYLQWDQGQFLVGNIMWRATNSQPGFTAPRPIRGDEFGFGYFELLNNANDAFSAKVGSHPFFVDADGTKNNVPSVTSFLCTDAARAIYGKANDELAQWKTAKYPDYQPTSSALTNQEALDQAHSFLAWVNKLGNRGTPHRV